MALKIFQEEPVHRREVFYLIQKAFKTLEISDHREGYLVKRLRGMAGFDPRLSLVAEQNGQLVGHILLSPMAVEEPGPEESSFLSLSLAPLSVHPDFQNQGIGTALTWEALEIAKKIGYPSVIVVGHPQYYPRFGFKPAKEFGLSAPFEVPHEAFLALELIPGAFKKGGLTVYPPEFFEGEEKEAEERNG